MKDPNISYQFYFKILCLMCNFFFLSFIIPSKKKIENLLKCSLNGTLFISGSTSISSVIYNGIAMCKFCLLIHTNFLALEWNSRFTTTFRFTLKIQRASSPIHYNKFQDNRSIAPHWPIYAKVVSNFRILSRNISKIGKYMLAMCHDSVDFHSFSILGRVCIEY